VFYQSCYQYLTKKTQDQDQDQDFDT